MDNFNQFRDFVAPSNLLKNKNIVITGAGDGIGKAVSIACAKAGATVVLAGKTQSKLEAVYDLIEQDGGPQPAIYPINLAGACEQDYLNMKDVLQEEFGQLDGLLHNASTLGPRTPIESYSYTLWQEVMQVNVNAPFMMTKALLPLMRQSKTASILFTTSSVGENGRAFWGAYAASKAAVENLTVTLSEECGETTNIRVNCINPGATRTAMRAQAYPAEKPTTVTTPEEIANRYLYLLSDASKEQNGQRFDAQEAS